MPHFSSHTPESRLPHGALHFAASERFQGAHEGRRRNDTGAGGDRVVERYRSMGLDVTPSFFELTTIMAFDYFARRRVDVAVIETGLGGRLDTTNIITPALSIITNISSDHTAQLGDTPAQIAGEKAGIIKRGIPVVIGNSGGDGVREVFVHKATEEGAPLIFADGSRWFDSATHCGEQIVYGGTYAGKIIGELSGDCQKENAATILCAVDVLRRGCMTIDNSAVRHGFARVRELTGLAGRWMKLGEHPLTMCDTGHNEGGMAVSRTEARRVRRPTCDGYRFCQRQGCEPYTRDDAEAGPLYFHPGFHTTFDECRRACQCSRCGRTERYRYLRRGTRC